MASSRPENLSVRRAASASVVASSSSLQFTACRPRKKRAQGVTEVGTASRRYRRRMASRCGAGAGNGGQRGPHREEGLSSAW